MNEGATSFPQENASFAEENDLDYSTRAGVLPTTIYSVIGIVGQLLQTESYRSSFSCFRVENKSFSFSHFLTCFFSGIIGNAFAIFILASSKELRRKIINVLLINQSAIDLTASIFTIACGPNKEFVFGNFSGIAGQLYCRIWAPKLPMWAMFTASSYNLVLINLERYEILAQLHSIRQTSAAEPIVNTFLFKWSFLCVCFAQIPECDPTDISQDPNWDVFNACQYLTCVATG